MATALAALMSWPAVTLAAGPSPLHELTRLPRATGAVDPPRVFIKRDDLLSFGCGGNKVRKIETVVAKAKAAGADTIITCGGAQSNHARVTAAAGAALGLHVVLVLNGQPPVALTGNAKLDALFGAEVRFVSSRDDREAAMNAVADDARAAGRTPFVIPLGASTPTGAIGFARGIAEVATAAVKPTAIVHASSSGGTQAGLICGCALLGLAPRIVGISADEPAARLAATVRGLLEGVANLLGARPENAGASGPIDVDDTQVGDGYGIPTTASQEALELTARSEGILLDPVYTAKAMAGLIARLKSGEFTANDTVLFWHTGGQPGFFA
jgi:1-aminocyclopropane-1-carboxylate deaminase/D-cysteine desulfhydrase-like pyridoxal-dependent ACC family enzyme